MRSTFWQGMLWGWVATVIFSMMFGSLNRSRHRPLMERGSAAICSVTRDLFGEAYRFRRHLMRRFH